MQGRRGTVGSLPETLLDHGSSSSNAAIDEHVCWNNILNPIESRLSDCFLSANDMNIEHGNSIAREEHELGRCSLREPSSSGTHNEASHNERKTNLVWSSSGSASAVRYEHNTLFGRSSDSNAVPHDINLNASLTDHDEGHRASCKRKALEGNDGQSSASGSSNYFHRSENSLGQVYPRLGLDVSGSASVSIREPIVLQTPEGARRNLRRRINPSSMQESIAPTMFSIGDTVRHSVVSSQHSSRPVPTDHSPDLRSAPVSDNASAQNSTVVNHVPTLPRIVQPFRLNVASTYRSGSSSGTNASSAATRVPHTNPSLQYPRRSSELVRRSLMSSLGAESEGHVNHSPLPSGLPNSPEEMLLSSGIANQGRHRQYPRPVSWSGRQDTGLLGVPHPLRTLAAATGGRSRLLASEIRNVLDLMRRGENLRFEDVMILDQSLIFGVSDIHDRHRDMRLDVDNMSYEELLALEDRIGDVNTGLSEETILNRLKQRKFSSTPEARLEAEPCCVCQEEYNDGENLGILECGHNFHADCIKQWLMNKNLCPVCKTTGLAK